MNKRCYFLIPAAGSGKRMGGDIPKLLIDIEGLPVIGRTLEAIRAFAIKRSDLDVRIVLITTPDIKGILSGIVSDYFPDLNISYTEGGDTRAMSVYNGIKTITDAAGEDLVLIHDGARCLITSDEIDKVARGLENNPVCACAVPVKDTLKEVTNEGGVITAISTPQRSSFYAVQTPQGFRYDALCKCFPEYEADPTATDDTTIAEHAGLKVTLVEGNYSNIKITTPEDVAVAREIVKARWKQIPFED